MKTRTQYRAICPACFKQHAVKDAAMVDHGYTIPHAWHQRQGSCGGATEPHFGTPEGLEVTKSVRRSFERYLAEQVAALAQLQSGRVVKINGPKTHGYKAPVAELTKADGLWFTDAIKRAVYQTESQIRGVTGDIKMLGDMIAGWKPAEPVAVEVETGPTVHQFNERSPAKVSCNWSRNSHAARVSSKVESEVTCAACLKAIAAAAADKAAGEQARAIVAAMVAKFGDAVTTRYSSAADAAVKEIRYRMKDTAKEVRAKACRIIEG